MSTDERAQDLISRFLNELPFIEGKPAMQTDEAKQCAIVAVRWMKDSFAGEYHKRDCDNLIKAIKNY